MKIALVASRFNNFIVDRLLEGARARLMALNVPSEAITVVRVPGAFELPQTVKRLADSGAYDGIVPLGCIIRGETPHFDHLARAVSHGLMRVSLESPVPIVFGVLTVHSVEQAEARLSKGAEVAESLIELIIALRTLK